MLFLVFLVIGLALGALVLTALVLALTSVVFTLLPVNKVPLRYNLRNLQTRWKTTLVTALAFTLVTALLTVMLAFVRGMDRITQSSAVPGNVIVLADGATDEVFSNIDPSAQFPPAVTNLIEKGSARSARPDTPLISREVYVLVSHVVEKSGDGGRKRRFIQMRGVNDPVVSATVHGLELADGRWWTDVSISGVKEGNLVVVVGDGIAKTLGADNGKASLEVGDIVQIGPSMCYVAGLLKPHGSFGSEVWALDQQVQDIFRRGNKYSSFVIRTANDDVADDLAKKLKSLGTDKYNAYTEKAYYARLEENNQVFRIAIYFLGIVMAVGGVLGVMNTMFAAISQRAKDIGVLRLLGYTRFQILCSFIFESLLIAFLGGILGCLLGLLTDGWTATSIVSSNQGGGKSVVLQLVVDIQVLIPGMVLALVMGAVGGLIPSLNAMRLKPLESLR